MSTDFIGSIELQKQSVTESNSSQQILTKITIRTTAGQQKKTGSSGEPQSQTLDNAQYLITSASITIKTDTDGKEYPSKNVNSSTEFGLKGSHYWMLVMCSGRDSGS